MTHPPYDAKLSEAERELAFDMLKDAYAVGRIDGEELDRRMDAAIRAHTRGAMEPLVADLPRTPPAPASVATPAHTDVPRGAERSWGMCAHLLGLGTSFLGPMLLARSDVARRSAYVRRQAREAANFQLCLLGALIATALLSFVTFGVAAVLYIPLSLAWMVMPFIGMTHAGHGRPYRYPLVPGLLGPRP